MALPRLDSLFPSAGPPGPGAEQVALRIDGSLAGGLQDPVWTSADGLDGKVAWTLAAQGQTLGLTLKITPDLPGDILGQLVGHHPVVDPVAPVASGASDDLLGSTAEVAVALYDGTASIELPLSLASHSIGAAGVGAYRQEWTFYFQPDGSADWLPVGEVSVVVYVLADRPVSPWLDFDGLGPTPLNVPWTTVLDHACAWAAGATSVTDVAKRLVRSFYDDVAINSDDTVRFFYMGDAPTYVIGTTADPFELELDRLLVDLNAADGAQSIEINCTDATAIVATFAGILGCQVCRIRIEPPPEATYSEFEVHDVGPLGWGRFDSLSGSSGSATMGYHDTCHHDVAVLSPPTIDGLRIYELCFELDTDGDPESAPHTRELPLGMEYVGDYLPAFVDHPNHSWEQSTERTCGRFEVVLTEPQPVNQLLAPTIDSLAVEFSQRSWTGLAEWVRAVEQLLSAGGDPVAYLVQNARITRAAEHALRSVVIRFVGPLPLPPSPASPPGPLETTLLEVELFRADSPDQLRSHYQHLASTWSQPGQVLADTPTFKAMVFGRGRAFQMLDCLLLMRWRQIGSSRVAPAPPWPG